MSEAITRGDFADSYGADPEVDETNYRQLIRAEKKKNKADEEKKDDEGGIASEGMKAGTGKLLKYAWLNLISSFGLTLIYINAHVFLRQVFPDAFCKLGEEWVPKKIAGESASNVGGTAFGIAEIIGLLFLDIVVFYLIFQALAWIIFIVSFWDEGILKGILKIWSVMKSLGLDGVGDLINLFK